MGLRLDLRGSGITKILHVDGICMGLRDRMCMCIATYFFPKEKMHIYSQERIHKFHSIAKAVCNEEV